MPRTLPPRSECSRQPPNGLRHTSRGVEHMAVLLTGVTGLVGARLLPRLVAAGVDCRALVRGRKEVLAGVTSVEGDLLEPAMLAHAVDGISNVIHLAAVFRTQDTDLIWKSNLEG